MIKLNILKIDGKLKLVNDIEKLINSEEIKTNETAIFFLNLNKDKLKKDILENNLLIHNIPNSKIIIKNIKDYSISFAYLNINFTPILLYINKTTEEVKLLPIFHSFQGIKQ